MWYKYSRLFLFLVQSKTNFLIYVAPRGYIFFRKKIQLLHEALSKAYFSLFAVRIWSITRSVYIIIHYFTDIVKNMGEFWILASAAMQCIEDFFLFRVFFKSKMQRWFQKKSTNNWLIFFCKWCRIESYSYNRLRQIFFAPKDL